MPAAVAAGSTIKIADMPEVLWAMRRMVAEMLRAQSKLELDTHVAARLRSIAANFEAGQ